MELCQSGVVSFSNVKNVISEGVLIYGPLFVITMTAVSFKMNLKESIYATVSTLNPDDAMFARHFFMCRKPCSKFVLQ